jgi:hypothetical protein
VRGRSRAASPRRPQDEADASSANVYGRAAEGGDDPTAASDAVAPRGHRKPR